MLEICELRMEDRNRRVTMRNIDEIIIRRVRSFAVEHGMLRNRERLLLSLSAGKDSVALLDIMSRLADSLELTLGIFHLNHLARGKDSDDDEKFVIRLAKSKGLKLYIERVDCTVRPRGKSFEDFARDKRYELLNEIACVDSWTRVATAHTMSDNSETVLMRILRGTGIHGLRGIDPVRGVLVRPLLRLSSSEVYAYLRLRELEWREDESNNDSRFLRNFVRNELIPEAESRFPGAAEALARLSDLAVKNESIIEHLVRKVYGTLYTVKNGSVLINTSQLDNDERIIRHALITVVRDHFGEYISSARIEETLKLYRSLKSNAILRTGSNLEIRFDRERQGSIIRIGRVSAEASRTPSWEYRVNIADMGERPLEVNISEIGYGLTVCVVDYSRFLEEGRNGSGLFLALPGGVDYIIVRSRARGDRMRLAAGTKKIKDILIDMKVPLKLRDSIPVVIAGDQTAALMTGVIQGCSHRVGCNFMVSEMSQKILAIYRVGG
mgnify:CR=1 FL=1